MSIGNTSVTDTTTIGSIALPPGLFRNLSNSTELAFLFGAYRSSALYPLANQTDKNFSVASTVISSTVIGFEDDIADLDEDDNVVIVLKLHSEVGSKHMIACAKQCHSNYVHITKFHDFHSSIKHHHVCTGIKMLQVGSYYSIMC
ncbi:MAG: hypothetical protein A6F71_09235 [Cycloclasticus sp. symbiont of Poecilosclerida sp. M]|nr:MAG: hypothetical protein A6F71_09235 [Cycloclasticus sp. symbiont of Poecilosclerida sp. M]